MNAHRRAVLPLDLPGTEVFRESIRDWLKDNLGPDLIGIASNADLSEDDLFRRRLGWERQLGDGNWVGLAWPEAYGGRGVTLAEQAVFEQEYARSGAPERMGSFGEHMLGPLLIARGSEEQRTRFLPGILSGREIWCQAFSEPDAGSDLASVGCRAVESDGQWSITGSKVWTSYARYADWTMALVRTGTPESRHRGLTFMLVPLAQPGVEIRPLREMSGGAHFNEVFFDGAKTDVGCVVGAPGDGWSVANTLLTFERGTSLLATVWGFEEQYEAVLRRAQRDGLTDDARVRQQLAASWTSLRLVGLNVQSTLMRSIAGVTPGLETSLTKVMWTEWHQKFTSLALSLRGLEGMVRAPSTARPYYTDSLQHDMLFSRAETIYAGSSQIQRNLISERILGLPRQ